MAFSKPDMGLRGLFAEADLGLLASGAVVFGVQRLVPTYDQSWYKSLKKPSWTPKNWVFPAVWIPLKILQSVAAWAVYKQGGERAYLPLAIFGGSLFLGNWWNVVFFGKHELKGSLPWMGAFWASIAGTIASFHQVSPTAAGLVAPTLLWVTIASKLNYDIVQLNIKPDAAAPSADKAASTPFAAASAGKAEPKTE